LAIVGAAHDHIWPYPAMTYGIAMVALMFQILQAFEEPTCADMISGIGPRTWCTDIRGTLKANALVEILVVAAYACSLQDTPHMLPIRLKVVQPGRHPF
jgi:hypothetical protein